LEQNFNVLETTLPPSTGDDVTDSPSPTTETEKVSEMLDFCSILAQLNAREECITFSCHDSLKSYTLRTFINLQLNIKIFRTHLYTYDDDDEELALLVKNLS
jgi:hypothetical protein